jgi:hypothetical protein
MGTFLVVLGLGVSSLLVTGLVSSARQLLRPIGT